MKLLEKIEELTLHLIKQDETIKEQQFELSELKNAVNNAILND